MSTLDELAPEIQIAFWGAWNPRAEPMVEPPDQGLCCYRCVTPLGADGTGASVRADESIWLHYHDECYGEAVEEWKAHDTVAGVLDGEDLEAW